MTIRMNDFKAEPVELRQAELEALAAVVESGWYVLGENGERFERQWADACATEHAIGTGNGMDAIEIGLRALDIGAGDEVVTTPMTAFATTLAVLRAGAVPVLADIDPATGLLDPISVERCISDKTKAILLVHLYGRVGAMDRWQDLARKANILLLEDCAQAHLAKWNGRCAGTFGEFGAYSFYPTKNLGSLGDGGALITGSDSLATRARCLRNYGQSQRYHHPELGLNSRLDELHAALLNVRLKWLPRFTARRQKIAEAYWARINNPRVRLLDAPASPEQHVHHLFVVTCATRDHLATMLAERGIQTLIHYPVPVHLQPPTVSLRRDPAGLGHAELHAATCLSLPCHPQMTDDEVATVIDAVNAYR